jgi:hypothetical protein
MDQHRDGQVLYTLRSESRCALRLRYVDLVVSSEVAVEIAVVSLYSVVKQHCIYIVLSVVFLKLLKRYKQSNTTHQFHNYAVNTSIVQLPTTQRGAQCFY